MISILKEDNVLSMAANLPKGPPMNADNDYYRAFLADFFVSVAIVVVQYLFGEEKPVIALYPRLQHFYLHI